MTTTVKFEVVHGTYGHVALYADDQRIAGQKPWGGGQVERTFVASQDCLLRAESLVAAVHGHRSAELAKALGMREDAKWSALVGEVGRLRELVAFHRGCAEAAAESEVES